MVGIYKITNPNGKIYIGQSSNIEKRFERYKKGDCIGQYALFNSLIKYGWINHIFEVIEICDNKYLNDRERYYQEKYDVLSGEGLNCVLVNSTGKKTVFSEESINKMSENAKKRIISDIKRKHHSNVMKGRKLSDEHKKNISNSTKGIKKPWLKGTHTSAHQKKMASIKNKKSIYQYDLNLNFIKKWDSIKEAAIQFNSKGTSISACCRGKNKSAFGYKWFFIIQKTE